MSSNPRPSRFPFVSCSILSRLTFMYLSHLKWSVVKGKCPTFCIWMPTYSSIIYWIFFCCFLFQVVHQRLVSDIYVTLFLNWLFCVIGLFICSFLDTTLYNYCNLIKGIATEQLRFCKTALQHSVGNSGSSAPLHNIQN